MGICGSGLIDILAELFLAGIINQRGKIEWSWPNPGSGCDHETGGSTCWSRADEPATARTSS